MEFVRDAVVILQPKGYRVYTSRQRAENALRHAILTGNCTQSCGKIPAMGNSVYEGERVHGGRPSHGPSRHKAVRLETAVYDQVTRRTLCGSRRGHNGT